MENFTGLALFTPSLREVGTLPSDARWGRMLFSSIPPAQGPPSCRGATSLLIRGFHHPQTSQLGFFCRHSSGSVAACSRLLSRRRRHTSFPDMMFSQPPPSFFFWAELAGTRHAGFCLPASCPPHT